MRRAVGFALLLLSALVWAGERVRERAAQNEVLAAFCALLAQLYGLLETEGAPMPELLHTLTERTDGAARDFAALLSASLPALGERSFEELYRAALEQNPVARDRDARRELASLGAVLGRYELRTQLEAVSDCLSALRGELEKRRGEACDSGRLTLGLALSGAALLGIILL